MITILMALYNGHEYMNESIESIQQQTYQDWELIIGINGHSLNSEIYQLAKQYENNKIKVVQFEEKGKSITLNKLIQYAKYKHIAIMDVDDIWYPYKLQYQVPFIKEYDVVGTQCIYFGDMNQSPNIPLYDISKFNMKLVNPMINSSVIIKKKLCYWDGLVDGIEDYDLWLRLWKDHKTFYNCPDILVKHRIHQTSSFNSKTFDVETLINKYERLEIK